MRNWVAFYVACFVLQTKHGYYAEVNQMSLTVIAIIENQCTYLVGCLLSGAIDVIWILMTRQMKLHLSCDKWLFYWCFECPLNQPAMCFLSTQSTQRTGFHLQGLHRDVHPLRTVKMPSPKSAMLVSWTPDSLFKICTVHCF